ncbi:MAG: VWA domain-containing protein [Rhizobiales bacterium]|nr:VWA domain-containing protein [Hyphomicrobiales bacterium]NRB15745.1 VWA domain-containing protein [Hyphomicrobiales bacterium]
MKILLPLLVCTTIAIPIVASGASGANDKTPNNAAPAAHKQTQAKQQTVEVVFVLDTTGSMGGLLEGAKNKIWHIANEIQNAKSDVNVRMGLIAYRDRGDVYVTKHFPISSDIHQIYADLIEFRAAGGGDAPESVNQALSEAVTQLNWSQADDTLRIIFLVGDAPPKMNYSDDMKYTQTVKIAKRKDIIINTILAGNSQRTKKIWQEIAQNANGAFSQIAQDGNVTIIKTPYDEQIHQLNIELNATIILYGDKKVKQQASKVMKSMARAAPAASSDMASYNAKRLTKSQVFSGKGDLLQELELNRATIDNLILEELPKIMQAMDDAQRQTYIAEMQTKRTDIQQQIDELVKQRAVYKADEIGRLSAQDQNSFDANLMKIIKQQAALKNIKY